jgi:hypothetical protein
MKTPNYETIIYIILLAIILVIVLTLLYTLLCKCLGYFRVAEYFQNTSEIWVYFGSWCAGNTSVYGGSIATDVPTGVTGVCLSFCNWTFENGQNTGLQNWMQAPPLPDNIIEQYVTDVHSKSAKAIISFGGSTFPFPYDNIPSNLINDMVAFVQKFKFDGVDLDIENRGTDEGSDAVLLNFCSELRQKLPQSVTMNFSIQSTVPSQNISPWKGIIQSGAEIFTTIGIQCYNSGNSTYTPSDDVGALISKGWKPSQILIGVMPGPDNTNHVTNETTISSWKTDYIDKMGLKGIFMWSTQRDTQQVTACNSGDPPAGKVNGYYMEYILSLFS